MTTHATSALHRLRASAEASSPVAAAPAAGPIDAGRFRLRLDGDLTGLVARLDERLPAASVRQVADDGNRTGEGLFAPEVPLPPRYAGLLLWDDDDPHTRWYPQGITGSADARADGRYEDRRLLLVSWYDNLDEAPDKGVRVSFINPTNIQVPTYRHVLLVEPCTDAGGEPSFRAVTVHAGA
ncbi:MAG: hypothetical protein GEV28_23855 [Actinophytocola sp.]|uniref:hypothetical protein n=1 Tax=Actinophytocola sp. TaxID=1872138 RepID=UPI001323DE28|nr:hypothetical protein [Actinophytocola sp.]MPZ83260.1 hypothetical protein [Actinophytocola sp.]